MSELRLPLDRNMIRRNKTNNAYGMVRTGGKQAHQGWDLLATPFTNCYAIADGTIYRLPVQSGYGTVVALEFEHRGRKLYAFYAHLSTVFVADKQLVRGGDTIALTGRSGNASNLTGDDMHLHFEIRTQLAHPGLGLAGRIDPVHIFGFTPLYGPHLASRNTAVGSGLKVKSIAF